MPKASSSSTHCACASRPSGTGRRGRTIRTPWSDSFEIQTPLPPEAAFEKLTLEVEPPNRLRAYNTPHKFFEGARDGAEFYIRRVLTSSKNGFLPEARITAAPHAGGARIHVKMHPPKEGMIFIILWSIPFVLLFFVVLPVSPLEPLLFVIGMPVFVWIFSACLFQIEGAKAKRKLLEIFNGAIAAPPTKANTSTWPNG
jgi:hypothetical protein